MSILASVVMRRKTKKILMVRSREHERGPGDANTATDFEQPSRHKTKAMQILLRLLPLLLPPSLDPPPILAVSVVLVLSLPRICPHTRPPSLILPLPPPPRRLASRWRSTTTRATCGSCVGGCVSWGRWCRRWRMEQNARCYMAWLQLECYQR